MALWEVLLKAPCFDYIDFGMCYDSPPSGFGWWWTDLIKCPKHYAESLTIGGYRNTLQFFYNPSTDTLVGFAIIPHVSAGYRIMRMQWNCDTGELVEEVQGAGSLAVMMTMMTTLSTTMGSYNKIYSVRGTTAAISEVDWWSLYPGAVFFEGGYVDHWTIYPKTWTPANTYYYAVANPQDGYLAACPAGGNRIDCWRNINTTPQLIGSLYAPNDIAYMCWESRTIGWAICSNGTILKFNYTIPRIEMISTVQNPTDDTVVYRITFDTIRHRVVVLRVRTDAEDGACRAQLEFYYPMVKPFALTQPVPVSSLRTKNRVVLVAHLIGDAGEGLTPYIAYGTMVPPVEGLLVTPFTNVELNGRMSFQYQAPSTPCTETLQINVTVIEGITEET